MMGEDGCIDTFTRSTDGADIAIIEGVMGLYDGVDGTDLASTAHVARILRAPVILVADARGMSRSVHALIRGYHGYDPALVFPGVIINRIGSPRHRMMIEKACGVPVFGYIPRDESLVVESRHLGLKMAHESGSLCEAGKVIGDSVNLDALLAAAGQAPLIEEKHQPRVRDRIPGCVVGVALDDAFCFYYRDNLDLLTRSGARLVFFSPLQDRLPEADAVYLGGGYPELHLPSLESSPCTRDIRAAAEEGMPVYGECGGLMYLSREIRDRKSHRMCGVLPATADMTPKIQALGYVRGSGTGSIPFLPRSSVLAGHEFHYSRLDPDSDARYAITLSRGKGISKGLDGLVAHDTVGCYTHAYFSAGFAGKFIESAKKFSRR
jgi:cobyrinic acid a,c-diamide synthase